MLSTFQNNNPSIKKIISQDTLLYFGNSISVNIFKENFEFYKKILTKKDFEFSIFSYHVKDFLIICSKLDSISKDGIHISIKLSTIDSSQQLVYQDLIDFSGNSSIYRTGGNEKQPPFDFSIISDVRGTKSFDFIINKKLPKYHFNLIGDSLFNVIDEIHVYREGSNKVIQTISVPAEMETPFKGANYFFTKDFNFDGYQDISLLQNWGVTGNKYYFILLFNKTKGKFIYNKVLSSLGSPKLNYSKNEINSFERSGYGNYYYSTFKWIKHNLVLIKEIVYKCNDSTEYAIRTESILEDGKMKVVNKRKVDCGSFEK